MSTAPADGTAVTLAGFLAAIFPPGTPPESIHLTHFAGDPAHAQPGDWQGRRHRPFPYELPAGHNQYFCIGVLDPNTHGRLSTQVLASPIVALDDVGTKVDVSLVSGLLSQRGLRPHAIVETSPDNFSLYYKTVPAEGDERHQRLAGATLRQRLKELRLSDPATQDPARYMRLPFGINGKPRAGGAWAVRLRKWEPDAPPILFDDWMRALFGDQARQHAAYAAQSGSAALTAADRLASFRDPMVKLAAELGLDPHVTRSGVIEAICPFGYEHSDGDQTGFAFVNWGRCHCHHGHCVDRTSRDFLEKLVELYDERIKLAVLDGQLRWTPDDGLLVDNAGQPVPANAHSFMSRAAFEDRPLPADLIATISRSRGNDPSESDQALSEGSRRQADPDRQPRAVSKRVNGSASRAAASRGANHLVQPKPFRGGKPDV